MMDAAPPEQLASALCLKGDYTSLLFPLPGLVNVDGATNTRMKAVQVDTSQLTWVHIFSGPRGGKTAYQHSRAAGPQEGAPPLTWDYSLILVYLSDTLLWSLAYPLHKFVQFYVFLVPVVVADFPQFNAIVFRTRKVLHHGAVGGVPRSLNS